MIRIVFVGALALILCAVLYIPSTTSPERFIETIKMENAAHRAAWGDDAANRIMVRLLDLHQGVVQEPPPAMSSSAATLPAGSPQAAVTAQVGQMGARMFANSYFKSIEALMMLATYRACALIELLPLALLVLVVVAIDGFVVRVVRSREFVPHSAELFSASAACSILVGSLIMLSMFLPLSMPPMYITAAIVVMLFILSRAISNYHLIR